MKVILLLPGLGAEIEMYIPLPPSPPLPTAIPHLPLNPPESKGRERLKLWVTHIPLSLFPSLHLGLSQIPTPPWKKTRGLVNIFIPGKVLGCT